MSGTGVSVGDFKMELEQMHPSARQQLPRGLSRMERARVGQLSPCVGRGEIRHRLMGSVPRPEEGVWVREWGAMVGTPRLLRRSQHCR